MDGKKPKITSNLDIYNIMNMDEFKKIIGESIDSKLREILPSVLDEYFSGMKPQSKGIQEGNVRKQMNDAPKQSRPAPPAAQSPAPKRQYVKNTVLNDILNETTVRIKQEGQMVSGGPSTMTTESPSVLDNMENVPKSVATALTRDYSQLLKLSKSKSPKI